MTLQSQRYANLSIVGIATNYTAVTFQTELMDESTSSPLSDQPISLKLESVLESRPPDAQRSTAYHGGVESPPPGPSSNHWMTGGAQGGESGES